jgi:hypothetical protein
MNVALYLIDSSKMISGKTAATRTSFNSKLALNYMATE